MRTVRWDKPSAWVEQTLAGLTVEEKVGQLLHPVLRLQETRASIARIFAGIVPGGVSLASGTRAECLACTNAVQSLSPKVPVLCGTDLENGPGRILKDATQFPDAMGLAATGSAALAYAMGRSAAVEGRACGVHWSFSPVVDINANPFNPITNTRSLGDRPALISRLAAQLIRGMQEHGLAACAKHFPGDGFDDRDQHVCTTVNPLRLDDWVRLSGRMFQDAIDAGVWTIMIGHIALPAWDPGQGNAVEDAPPATLSRRLLTDLLRNRMGFQGLIVTDALNMGGVVSRADRKDLILGTLEAGSDLLLFAEMERDYAILMQALKSGRLTLERVETSVRRILRVKELLGLHQDARPRKVSAAALAQSGRAARKTAEQCLTLVANRGRVLPLKLARGSKVFSLHVLGDPEYNVNGLDDLLRRRGLKVTTATAHGEFNALPKEAELRRYDAVLVHYVWGPTWGTVRIRPNGNCMRNLWVLYGHRLPRVVSISYGTPYLLYEFPHMPALLNAYSPDPTTQAAVVRFLMGEIPAPGRSPVDVRAPWRNARTWAGAL